jgi:hypothetical protein
LPPFDKHDVASLRRNQFQHDSPPPQSPVDWWENLNPKIVRNSGTLVLPKYTFNGNFRILKWRYCTIYGRILGEYSLT